MIDEVEVERRFTYQKPTERSIPKFERIRAQLVDAACVIAELMPPGREQSLAITKLEEAMMWASAGIARPQPPSFDARDRQDTPKPE